MKNCTKRTFRYSLSLVLFVFLLTLFFTFGGTAGYAETYTVSNTNDSGPGSLRAAIASADSYDDVISFAVTGTITLNSTLEISGDKGMKIQGPGGELLAVSGNNECGVFYISTTASVDISGISIVNGSADDGGGMYNFNSSPTVTNCTFSQNTATYDGGGMYNFNSSPTVTNCTFSGNSVTYDNFGGGGMSNYQASPNVTNCTFSSNSASHNGGGMYNDASSPTVTNCTFSLNSASNIGGGMYNDASSPKVTNCTFSLNSADYGGGMYNYESNPTVTDGTFSLNSAVNQGGGMRNQNSSPTVTNCTFTSNTGSAGGGMANYYSSSTIIACTFSSNAATSGGGGMYNYYDYLETSPTVIGCTFSGNIATSGGGMSNNFSPSPTVINCTFSGNTASRDWCGGMRNYESSPSVTNCTFTGNTAPNYAFGMFNAGNVKGSSPIVRNCIFWDIDGEEIYNSPGSVPTLSFCIVQSNDVGGGTISNDIISADPRLETLADNGGPTWTCALSDDSPALDTGLTILEISTDQRGAPRPYPGGSFDIGAYESGVGFYTITATWSEGGTITPEVAHTLAGIEEEVFYLLPDEGYEIEAVQVDDVPVSYDEGNNTYTFEPVSQSHDIYASFVLIEDEDDNGGGCNISAIPAMGFLLLVPLMFLVKRGK